MGALELDRERVIQALCAHYANDHLSTQELETRFDLAYQAKGANELEALLTNLPALAPVPVAAGVPVPAPLLNMSPTVEPQQEKRTLALMSEVDKSGEWVPARRNIVKAIMGSVKLDLREALFAHGEVEIEVLAIMSEVKIIVPPLLRVECDGHAVMGEFKEVHSRSGDDPSAPLLRIRGMAFMGTVNVQTRLPGESSLVAWRRARWARRLKE